MQGVKYGRMQVAVGDVGVGSGTEEDESGMILMLI